MRLQDVITAMNASALKIDPALMERNVESFSIDSREVEAGEVFFALSQPDYLNNGFNGDFEDATKFVPAAFEKGAAACVVRPDRFEEHKGDIEQFENRLIFVDDTIKALQDLARRVYLDWNKPVVAITGSAGKTTAKELTAQVLSTSGRKVLKNIKNYNNGLGHPLTVLNLIRDQSYDVAVLEMGMSTPMNEIQRLCRITPPDVGVELNVLPVHVEHLGSIENVARAKAELIEGMKEGGTAVLNADDERVMAMRKLARGRSVTYGIDHSADITASDISFQGFGHTAFVLHTPGGEATVEFPLNGLHNLSNALAAAAVGHLFGMEPRQIAEALASAKAPDQRGEVFRFIRGFTVINDSYNSNPAALLSMVDTLKAGAVGGRTIVVAGEMLELGPEAPGIHRETGKKLAAKGIDVLIGVRGLSRELVDGAREGGLINSDFAADSDAGGELLLKEVKEGDVVLIKGSRGVRTERIFEKLLDKFELQRTVREGAAK